MNNILDVLISAVKAGDAAGFLIIEEAGGVVKGLKGENINFLSPTAVLGNKDLVKQFVERIKD